MIYSKTIRIRNDNALIFDPKQDETPFFFHGVKQNPRDISKRQHKSIKYDFHRVFGPQSSNEDIYNESTKDLLNKLLCGYNCSGMYQFYMIYFSSKYNSMILIQLIFGAHVVSSILLK